MTKILLLQGANMAWLGRRQPEIYGTTTADQLNEMLQSHASDNNYDLDIFYTHIEGEAIGRIFQGVEEGAFDEERRELDGEQQSPQNSSRALRDDSRMLVPSSLEMGPGAVDGAHDSQAPGTLALGRRDTG